jgi:hypothetical protein
MILHALKDDQTTTRCFDPVIQDAELVANPKRCNLALDQLLRGLRQRLLNFTNTDDPKPILLQAPDYDLFCKEVRFARTAPAPCALVPGWS